MPANSSQGGLEPIELYHGLSGWPPPGPNCFWWKDGRLDYFLPEKNLGPRDAHQHMVPTLEQWREFWIVCTEIDVWSFPPRIGRTDIFDGLEWHTHVEVGSRRVVSKGQLVGSPPELGRRLTRLHHALQAMTGWKVPDNAL